MKTLLTATAAATVLSAAMLAGSASAQVLGGQVGGGAQVGVGGTGGMIGSTVRDAAGLTTDTVRDTRDMVRDADPAVDARADASVASDAHAGHDGASAGADIQTGAMVHASDGGMVGSVTDVTRDTAGRVTAFTLRTADGATRTLPAASASVNGGVVVVPN